MHQVVLHEFRQIEAHQNPILAHIQFAQQSQSMDSNGPLKGQVF
jgi:hypothetical protein